MPCGQQGSWQYLCRRNCPPTSKGVPKRINFTPRREKGVNIWNGYPSSVTLLFGRHDRGKDLRLLLLLFFPTGSHHPSISLSPFQIFFSSLSSFARFEILRVMFGEKFKTRLKRGNRGYVNLLQRENWLASVIDSYVLRLRSFEGTGEFALRPICFLFMDNLTGLPPLHRHQLCSQFGIMLHVFGSRSTICQYKGVTRGSLHTNSRAEQLVILNTRNPLETPGPPLPYLSHLSHPATLDPPPSFPYVPG